MCGIPFRFVEVLPRLKLGFRRTDERRQVSFNTIRNAVEREKEKVGATRFERATSCSQKTKHSSFDSTKTNVSPLFIRFPASLVKYHAESKTLRK
jgi:hypothetical protein